MSVHPHINGWCFWSSHDLPAGPQKHQGQRQPGPSIRGRQKIIYDLTSKTSIAVGGLGITHFTSPSQFMLSFFGRLLQGTTMFWGAKQRCGAALCWLRWPISHFFNGDHWGSRRLATRQQSLCNHFANHLTMLDLNEARLILLRQ